MKNTIVLAALVLSFAGFQSTYANGAKGTCTVTNPDGTKTETESTKADCKGEFKAKAKAAAKKK